MHDKVMSSLNAVILVNNGELNEDFFFSQFNPKTQDLICCDGAANRLMGRSWVPDVIIGDLDSIATLTKTFFQEKTQMIYKPSQYKCDLEKALDYCVEKKYTEVVLTGLSGGRADYAIANFIVLKHYCEQLNIEIVGSDYLAYPIVDHWEKKCKPGQKLSLIPFGECMGIDLKGLKYPLDQANMQLGDIGVSNEVVDPWVSIKIASGYACVFIFEK